MNKKSTSYLLVLIILSGIIISCTKQANTKLVKIGAILPLSGVGSVPGSYLKNGLELAYSLDSSNSNIKLLFEDSKSVPNQGVAAYNKLSSVDKMDICITALSSVTMSLIPILKEDIPTITTLTTYPNITSKNNSLYRTFINSADEANVLAEYIIKDAKLTNIGIIYNNDEGGLGSEQAFSNAYSKHKGLVVFREAYPATDYDFRNLILKIKDTKGINALFIIGYGKSLGLLIKQIREARIQEPIFTMSQFGSSDSRIAAGETADGIIYSSPLYEHIKTQEKNKFDSLYFSKYNSKPNFIAAYGYETGLLVMESIRLKELKKISLKDAIGLATVTGINGSTLQFLENRELSSSIKIVQWLNNTEILLK